MKYDSSCRQVMASELLYLCHSFVSILSHIRTQTCVTTEVCVTTRSPQQLKSTVAAVTLIRPHKNSIVYMNNILELPVLEKEQDVYYYELT